MSDINNENIENETFMDNTEIEHDPPEPDPLPEPEPVMDIAEKKIQKLERILSGVSPGWQVAISRSQPGWAKGHLETIDVDDGDEPISLDYLARTWGGETLRVRVKDEKRNFIGGTDIYMMSYPPKRWGKIIKDPANEEPANNGLQNLDTLLGIVDKLKTPNGTDHTVDILKLLLKQQQTQTNPAPPPSSNINEFVKMAAAFQQLKGIFGDASSPAPVEDNMMGQLNSLLDTFMKIRNTQPKTPLITNKIASPNPPDSTANIRESLHALEPQKAAETILGVVGEMPSEQRNLVFENVLQMLGIADNNDNDTEEYEDEYEDEDSSSDNDESTLDTP